jgi:hypothetical protein
VTAERAHVVSSFTIIKGSMIEETYAAFKAWDWSRSKRENLTRMRDESGIWGGSANWARDVYKVLNRRFDPVGRDRPLVELAQAGCELHVWKPLLLWHMTRDEYLLRDFLVNWLYSLYAQGVCRMRPEDVVEYLQSLKKKRGIEWSGSWTENTTERVASGLLRMASDFGLLSGAAVKEFASYHLSEESFLYLLYALSDAHLSGRAVVESDEWRMYLLDQGDVEQELLRLHQFHKLRYEVAGTLVSLSLPQLSVSEYVKEFAT